MVNNGYASSFFEIQRGIRQGCPLSALLFILAVEILSLHIQHNKEIKGITIFNQEIKLTQLADDTTLFIKNKQSLVKALDALGKFHESSGLRMVHMFVLLFDPFIKSVISLRPRKKEGSNKKNNVIYIFKYRYYVLSNVLQILFRRYSIISIYGQNIKVR